MFALRYLAPAALVLALAGCHDARQDITKDYLRANPPKGFEVAAIPEKLVFEYGNDGASMSSVPMTYRLLEPTVETRDIFVLPRSVDLSKRISEVRGWALSSLPADDPTRVQITSAAAEARKPFATKHVVSAKGTEVEVTVPVTLRKKFGKWTVVDTQPAATAPGSADDHPEIPFEDAPEVTREFAARETATRQLEQIRQKYLAERQLAAARSLAQIRNLLKPGNVFEGQLPNGNSVRLVISQGAEAASSLSIVITTQRPVISSARYTGTIEQLPSGAAMWRASRISSLSEISGEFLTDAQFHPILTLAADKKGLLASATADSGKKISFRLEPVGTADLIPDISPQDVKGE
jgi:hypothetical protein